MIVIFALGLFFYMFMLINNQSYELITDKNKVVNIGWNTFDPIDKQCDEKLSIYYDELILCLQSVPYPQELDRSISDDVNERDKCNSRLNRDSQIATCLYHSNYRFIASTCSMMIWFDEENAILRWIDEVLCIKQYESLISSWDASLNFRRQLDGSSYISCYGNSDCPDNEYCSIQWVVRCEKIVNIYDSNVKLVNQQELELIISNKRNKIVSWIDTHSNVNSITLSDGNTYVVKNINIYWLVRKYYSEYEMSGMLLYIE